MRVHNFTAGREEGENLAKTEKLKRFQGLSPEKWFKPRPESGLSCFNCASFSRQRHAELVFILLSKIGDYDPQRDCGW